MITSFFRFNLISDNPKALTEFYRDIIGMPLLDEIDDFYDGVPLGFATEPHLCIWRADKNKKLTVAMPSWFLCVMMWKKHTKNCAGAD